LTGFGQVTAAIRLFGAAELDAVPWPDTAEGRRARAYLTPLVAEGPRALVANASGRAFALSLGDAVLPLTVHDRDPTGCWASTPSTQYHRYALSELAHVGSAPARAGLGALAGPWAAALRAGEIDRIVQVDSWLFSTHLHPDLAAGQIAALGALRDLFPDRAIVVRSLVDPLDGAWIDGLRALGARLIPSRQVYLVDPADRARWPKKARWLVGRETRMIAERGYTIVEHEALDEADLPRLRALYGKLYLEKYSPYNMDFSDRFFSLALRDRVLELAALRRDGRIDGMIGTFRSSRAITATLFGFDTALPASAGLYRMLSALTVQRAARDGLLLHASAGAAKFKRVRGATPAIEVHAVLDAHLPARRRAIWAALQAALWRVGVPLVRRYRL